MTVKPLFVDQFSAPVQRGESFCSIIDFSVQIKTASEVGDFVKSLQPEKGHIYLHTIALGAGEWYGPNRNGDYFTEEWLKKKHHTFVSKAKVFKHHKNKAHDKSYGKIIFSWYNDKMHRVELIIDLPIDENPDVVEKLKRGEGIAFSMGCRVQFDVCRICQNKARTPKEYCKHVAPKIGTDDFTKYGLNKILEDGRQICVDNPDPDFFDYSKVFRPADRTAYHLSKVAYTTIGATPSALIQEKYADYRVKQAYFDKLSDIVKKFTGVPIRMHDSSLGETDIRMMDRYLQHVYPLYEEKLQPFPKDTLNNLTQFPMNQIISTFVDNDIFLTTPEFIQILFKKITGKDVGMPLLKKFMQMQGDILKHFSRFPEDLDKIMDTGVLDNSKDLVNPRITEIIKPFKSVRITLHIISPKREKEAFFPNVLPTATQREMGYQPDIGQQTITLPSGEQFYARPSEVNALEDEERFFNTIRRVGGAAVPILAGGGLTSMAWKKLGKGSRPWVNTFARGAVTLPVIGASLLLARHMWNRPSNTEYVKTDQDNIVPARAVEKAYSGSLL